MDAGRVAEFGSPNQLLQNSSSIFTKLVMADKEINEVLYNENNNNVNSSNNKTDIILSNNIIMNLSDSNSNSNNNEENVITTEI
jgi:hypothetical protein